MEELASDVVVIGYGGAGACAAITAHDAGADVIVLEKMPQAGGNTRVSNCSWFNPPPGTEQAAIEHIDALCLGRTERAVIEAYVAEASRTKEWLEGFGASTKITRFLAIHYPQVTHPSWPHFPGSHAMVNHTVISERDNEPPGERLWAVLSSQVEKRGIRTFTDAPVEELLTDAQGQVIGVNARRNGKKISVKARRGVVLSCGGFEFNEAMKSKYLPVMPLYGIGNPGNTGDGIVMTEKIGAALWHMNVLVGGLGFRGGSPEQVFIISYPGPGFVYVNSHGRRFTNETGWEIHFAWQALTCFDPKHPGYPTVPVYGICDRETLRKGPLFPGTAGTARAYKWSPDNAAEVAKGWITQAPTPAELAKRLSMDPGTLQKTVDKYNEYCRLGSDPDFHRSNETLKPLATPPFYAIEMWPRIVNTMGGPRRDEKARVLSESGEPIARLYSAGELGSLWGQLYCGGGNVGEALAVGRIAGVNAAGEKPWC